MSEPPYSDYVEWDLARKARFPHAVHWIYQSRIGETKVAEWCPITGRCSILVVVS